MSNAYMPQAKTVEWSTPQNLFDELNEEFNFSVDVASTHQNLQVCWLYTERIM